MSTAIASYIIFKGSTALAEVLLVCALLFFCKYLLKNKKKILPASKFRWLHPSGGMGVLYMPY